MTQATPSHRYFPRYSQTQSVKEMDGGKGVTFACVNVADSVRLRALPPPPAPVGPHTVLSDLVWLLWLSMQVEDSATALRTFALRLGGKDAAEKAAFILGCAVRGPVPSPGSAALHLLWTASPFAEALQ